MEIQERKIPQLGFGFMRLAKKEDGSYDVEQIIHMVDHYLSSNYNYFDTAFVYDNGNSERMIKTVLSSRHPRNSFILASKLPLSKVSDSADQMSLLKTSLERTGVDYFDNYLIHNVHRKRIVKLDKYNTWDFMAKIKQDGLAKNIGFSFHDTADVLDGILRSHPEFDFVQLQLNYADWENEQIQSRKCYEIARAYNKPILVMEPIKGGSLANGNPEMVSAFLQADPNASPASWALRFVASLDGVETVLSGMSSFSQLEDNLSTFMNMKPLSEKEFSVIHQVLEIYNKTDRIPCTSCAYCVASCPMRIPIPGLIGLYNDTLIYGKNPGHQRSYGILTAAKGTASECISCKNCENQCPQHLSVSQVMKDITALFE